MGLLKEELEAAEAEGIVRAYRTGPDSCPQDCSSCLSFVTIHLGYRTTSSVVRKSFLFPLLKSGEPCFDCICHFCLVSIDRSSTPGRLQPRVRNRTSRACGL